MGAVEGNQIVGPGPQHDSVPAPAAPTVAAPAPAGLQAKVTMLWHRLICREPGDDFQQVLRKTTATVFLPIAPVPLFYAIVFGFMGWSNDGMLAMRLQSFIGIPFTLAILMPYVVLRIRRCVSTMVMDLSIFSILFFMTLTMINFPKYPNQSITMVISLMAILSQTRFTVVQCSMAGCMYAIASYNLAYLTDDGATLLLVPGYRNGSPWEDFVNFLGVLALQTLILAGVFLQSAEHVRHVEAANAAVAMSQQIVDLLRRYNTEGVRRTLDEGAAGVDPHLVASLRAMTANLESYKPFLPNYLFQDDDDGDKDDEGALEKSARSDSASASASASGRSARCGAARHPGCADDTSQSSRSTHIGDAASASGAGGGSDAPTAASPLALVGAHGGNAHFLGKVTYALVQCRQFVAHDGVALAEQLTRDASGFVEEVCAAADESKASLHCMVGDTVQLTWNATHRVLQPELKATRFLARLQRLDSGHCGAACTGAAHCYSLTTMRRQHAALVCASWLPALRAAYRLARRHRTMIVDEHTEAVASHHVELVAVDAAVWGGVGSAAKEAAAEGRGARLLVDDVRELLQPGAAGAYGSERRVLFAVLREFATSEELEWLYCVQQNESSASASAQVSAALRALAAAVVGDIASVGEGEGEGEGGAAEARRRAAASGAAAGIARAIAADEERHVRAKAGSDRGCGEALMSIPLIRRLDALAASHLSTAC